MVKNEAYLQWKLMLLKSKTTKGIIGILVAISVISIIIAATLNSCGINHITIISDLEKYEQTLDPEFCESLVDKILEFNDDCEQEIEILDCG